MSPFLWTAAILGILYGVPAYLGACAARALVKWLLSALLVVALLALAAPVSAEGPPTPTGPLAYQQHLAEQISQAPAEPPATTTTEPPAPTTEPPTATPVPVTTAPRFTG